MPGFSRRMYVDGMGMIKRHPTRLGLLSLIAGLSVVVFGLPFSGATAGTLFSGSPTPRATFPPFVILPSAIPSPVVPPFVVLPFAGNPTADIAAIASGGSSSGGGGIGGARIAPEIGYRPQSLTFRAVAGEGDPGPQAIKVFTTKDSSVLRFTIETDVDWLTASPNDGISGATNDRQQISVSVLTSTLKPGNYHGAVTVAARKASNDAQTVPVTLVITDDREPLVISEETAQINISDEPAVLKSDTGIKVTIPQGAIPASDDRDLQIEIKDVDVKTAPVAPDDTIFVRAIELNTLVDGEVSPTDYQKGVELVVALTEADVALTVGDTSRLRLLWFNENTEEWQPVSAVYEDTPPAGQMVALLDHFSMYAVGIKDDTPAYEPQATYIYNNDPVSDAREFATEMNAPIPVQLPTASNAVKSEPIPETALTLHDEEAATVLLAPPSSPGVQRSVPLLPSPIQPESGVVSSTHVEEKGVIGMTKIGVLGIVTLVVLIGVAPIARSLRRRRCEA